MSAQRAREEFHWRTLRQRLKRNLQSREKLPNTTAAPDRASVSGHLCWLEEERKRFRSPGGVSSAQIPLKRSTRRKISQFEFRNSNFPNCASVVSCLY